MLESPGGHSGPILFGGVFSHADVASMVLSKYPGIEIASAGFVDLAPAPPEAYPNRYKATVYGESQGLKLKALPEDAPLIESALSRN